MSANAPRERKRQIHFMAEATYATDPDADGSSYLYCPAEGITYEEQTEILDTAYSTSRNFPTEAEVGAQGHTVSFSVPLIGLSAAVGNGTDASTITNDWLDVLLLSALGLQVTTEGESVTGSTTTSLTTADSNWATAQNLVPVHIASIPAAAPRTQWSQIQSSATGTTNLAPTLQASPGNGAVAYGTKQYRVDDDGGSSLALVLTDDALVYTFLGGRITSLRITGEHKRRAMMAVTIQFDRRSLDTGKTSLPSAALVAPTPVKMFRSPVHHNNVRIPTRMVEIDFGLAAAEVQDTESTNGRAGYELVSIAPTVTIEPLRADTYDLLKQNLTRGPVLVQLGAGVVANSILNSLAVFFARAEAREVTYTAQDGITRNRVVFTAVDRIEFSAGVASMFMTIARA
jgi:hypothetical protein